MLKEYHNKREHYFKDENGKKQGEYHAWYSDGTKEKQCSCKDGKVNGEYTTWYINGKQKEHCFCVDGCVEGKWEEWHDNGIQAEAGFCVNSEKHGEFRRWARNGNNIEHIFYYRGVSVTFPVMVLVDNIDNITEEERLIIKMKYGFDLL